MSIESIYSLLKEASITDAGACSLLGNWEAESNCESVRVQGDTSTSRQKSKEYVEKVDNGSYDWAKDSLGFGLAQWTYYTRKENLLEFAKWQNLSVGNEQLQVEFALKELRNEYSDLFNALTTSNDLYDLTSRVCKEYERPAINNIDDRYKYALAKKTELGLLFATDTTDFKAVKPNYKDGKYPLLTRRLENVELYSVRVIQFLLNYQGYSLTINGLYNEATESAVKDYQSKHDLVADGQAGPLTWLLLIEGGAK